MQPSAEATQMQCQQLHATDSNAQPQKLRCTFRHQIFLEAVHGKDIEESESDLRRRQSHSVERRALFTVPDWQFEILGLLPVSFRVVGALGLSAFEERQAEFSTHRQISGRRSVYFCQRSVSLLLRRRSIQIPGNSAATNTVLLQYSDRRAAVGRRLSTCTGHMEILRHY